MMEAARTSETLVKFYQTTRRYNPEDNHLQLKLSSDGGDSDSKKCKRGYVGAYGGVWQCPRLAGVWIQSVGFVLARLVGMWLQLP
jgi:hypothetical protein